jgi:hypothetical protein
MRHFTNQKIIEGLICFGEDETFFLRLLHWGNIIIEGKTISSYDGATLHCPYN